MRKQFCVILLLVLAGAGCSYIMPPQKIPMDRGNYLDAVATSWKEQLLSNLVRLRYGDTLTSLEMTNVITSYELAAGLSAGYPVAWHPLHGTTGFRNTVSVGGTVAYSDKPAITYVPTRGDALAKTMIEPLDPSRMLKSLQTGWYAGYIFSCCIESINHLRNRSPSGDFPGDRGFYNLYQLFDELLLNGVIRITIDEAKAPTKYDVTLHMKDKISQEKEKTGPGKEMIRKGGAKAKQGKEAGGKADKKKEEKEDSAIGLLVVDKDCAKRENMGGKVKEFKKLLWSGASPQVNPLYTRYRVENPTPVFEDPKFWMGDVDDQKIIDAIKASKGKFDDDEIEELKAYIKQSFGRYEVYKIIDGNQQPLPSDPYCDKIVLQTRSLLSVFIMLSQFIDVPGGHVMENRAQKSELFNKKEPLFYAKPRNIMFEIKHSKERPRDAFVAVQHHDYWFYIADDKIDSKDAFSSTAAILSMSQTATPSQGAPVLTLPVQ